MNKKNPKISYDNKSHVLILEIDKSKSVDSDTHGNVVLDYDKKGKVVRINLYNFSFDSFQENRRAIKDFARYSKTAVTAK